MDFGDRLVELEFLEDEWHGSRPRLVVFWVPVVV